MIKLLVRSADIPVRVDVRPRTADRNVRAPIDRSVSSPIARISLDVLRELWEATVMKKAYGGVVIAPDGRVLLREPAGHYNGQVWTFAKGGPFEGESPEQTALREVFEETGVRGQIIGRIPGSFDGSNTSNEFFLMVPVEETGKFDWETLAITWAAREEAVRLLSMTSKPKRRERDLRILEAAFTLLESLKR